jgi:hypothetical protein
MRRFVQANICVSVLKPSRGNIMESEVMMSSSSVYASPTSHSARREAKHNHEQAVATRKKCIKNKE